MAEIAVQPLEIEVEPTRALQVEQVCAAKPGDIAAAMAAGFGELMGFAGANGLQPAGAPRAIYTSYDPTEVHVTLAVPIAGPTPTTAGGRVRLTELPAAHTLRFTHIGPYERLAGTYADITAWMKEHGYMESEADWAKFMPMWEEYATDPEHTAPEDLVTHIHLPLDR